jgi:large subunit ribosomal protein L10
MGGEALSIEQIESIAKLPAMDVLQGQMVGILASPITGLVRGLNQLIAGLAIALGQVQAEGKIGGDEPAEPAGEAESPPPEDGPDAGEDAETPAEEAPGDPVAEAETAEEEAPAETEPETTDEEAPSEGEEKEG